MTASNNVSGFVLVQPDRYGEPTKVSVQDYDFASTGPYNFNWSWSVLTIRELLYATSAGDDTYDGAPGPQSAWVPVYNGNQITLSNLPYATTSTLYFTNAISTNSGSTYTTNQFSLPTSSSGVGGNGSNQVAYIIVTNGWLGWLCTRRATLPTAQTRIS